MSIIDIPQPCGEIVDFSDCKKAAASKRFTLNLRPKYLESGVDVTAVSWSVPAGVTKDDEGFTTDVIWVRVSSGVVGSSYELTATATTSNSESLVFTITVDII